MEEGNIHKKVFSLGGGMGGKDLRVRIILILGLLGMVLILASSLMGRKKETPIAQSEPMTTQEYTQNLEKRLYEIVSSIDGVGKTKVMLTLESGVEYVYAQEEKRNTDTSKDFDGETAKKVQEKDNTQSSYILVDGPGGKKQALVQVQKEPVIKGVVIVCQGAGNPIVEQRIIGTVSTALNIATNRICVTKISE